ncbi:hypothetical protein [Cupriavidus necator]
MAQDGVTQRRSSTSEDSSLSREAMIWMVGLPDYALPLLLGQRFPRIVNTIAAKWGRGADCRSYLDSLLFDERGNRHGFPFEVVQEIAKLREHFDLLDPPHQDVWQ